MQEEAITNELMKVDRRDHVRVSTKRREMILDEFECCGVSAAEFAARIGVKYSTFAHWRQMRSRKQSGGGDLVSPAKAEFLPTGPNSASRLVDLAAPRLQDL